MAKNNEAKVFKFKDDNNIFYIYIKITDGSNFDFIREKKYQNIIYEGEKEFHNEYLDGYYHIIKFNTINYPSIKHMVESIEDILNKKDENEKYSDTIKSVINFFERISSEQKIDKLIGDIGEALFILKLINLNLLTKINDSLFIKDDYDNFDFSFPNQKEFFEIKSTTKFKSEIKLKNSQRREEDNCNVVVCKIDIEKDKINDNYFNILDLYQLIENKMQLSKFLLDKKEAYMNQKSFIEKYNFDIEKYSMQFLKKDSYPIINVIKHGCLKEIILILSANESLENEETFDSKILSKLNDKKAL